MKRCPECEFLYEDEQERCDMDGTALKFTSFLPPLTPPRPPSRPALKSIWGGLTIPFLVLVILSTVVVILYRATPATFSSSSGLKKHLNTQSETKLASDNSQATTASVPKESDEASALTATRAQTGGKPNRQVSPADEKPVTVGPSVHVQMEPAAPVITTAKPATSQTSPAPPAKPKPAASSYTIAVHPEPPPATPAPQSKTRDQDQDSKVKSFFKKAGRILKKPF